MFDFLGFLKPVTKWLMDNWGFFGMFVAMAMPVIVLVVGVFLAAVLVGLMLGLFKNTSLLGAKGQLKKANKLRKEGRYEEAYDIYVRIHEKHEKDKIVTNYDIGMLCKEGEENGWDLDDWDSSPECWFKRSLNPLNPETYYEYGMCLISRTHDNLLRAAEGAKHMHTAAKLGHKEAKAIAEKQDRDAAMAMARYDYRTAASLGNTEAQYVMSTRASGAEVAGWLELAADEKHVTACEALGTKYVKGDGVKENLSKAVTYLTVAAEQGRMNAQAYLGLVYNNKKYPRHDEETAIKWYERAAEQGHAYAMHNLAVIYANKMDQHAKSHNLTTRLDRLTDKTYLKYFDHYDYWKRKAAEHGVTPESLK